MSSDLVVFGEDWGRHPSSTQHLVRRIATSRRVVWINSIGMRRPQLTSRDIARVARKVARFAGWPQSACPATAASGSTEHPVVPDGISVLSLAAVSWPGSRIAFSVNKKLLGRQIRRHLQARDIRRPILWTSLPTALPAVGELGERAVVYYCGDDFGALAGVDHAPVLEMERRLVSRADLVLAASEALAARFPADKTRYLPHGADIALFATSAPRAAALSTGRPIAGFYGSLSDWIDVPLLTQVARRMPDWQIVLVGPVKSDVAPLAALSNVTLIPAQPHAALPGFSRHWDVSLLPFRDTAQIRACNPLKLREYMAAGTPIASTPFPALAPYLDLVSVGAGADGFVNAIRVAAADKARNSQRAERVKYETWDSRAADVARALAAL